MSKLEDDYIDGEYDPFQNPLTELSQNTPAEPPAKKKKDFCQDHRNWLLRYHEKDKNHDVKGKENQKKPQEKKKRAAKRTTKKKEKTEQGEGSILRVVKHGLSVNLAEAPSEDSPIEAAVVITPTITDDSPVVSTHAITVDSPVPDTSTNINTTATINTADIEATTAEPTCTTVDDGLLDISSSSMDISTCSSDSDLSESNPLLFEIAVHELESKVLTMEAKQQVIQDNQQEILARLAAIEQFLSYNNVPQPNWMQQQYTYQSPYQHHPSQQPYTPQLYHSPLSSKMQQSCQLPQTPPGISPSPTASSSVTQALSRPKPIPVTKASNALPSSVINKEKLKAASLIIKQHPKLRGESKAGTLAVKLARQAIFGDDVLVQCTPGGTRDLPALPNDELNLLKEEMFDQFSQYWSNPVEFEAVWSVCMNAVGQSCKRLRKL